MRISRILTLAGPNIWSRKTMLEIWLECDDSQEALRHSPHQQRARLKQWADASTAELDCALRKRAKFQRRIEDAASSVDLFAAVVLELQGIAGTSVEQIFMESTEPPRMWHVAVEFVEEAVGRLAVNLAHGLVWPNDVALPDFDECCRRLRDCAREASYGATTAPIVAAARARGIPVTRLDGDCLLQLGHGARQRRVLGVITGSTGYLAESISRDKVLTKRLMSQLGLPTAEGRLAGDPEDAWAAACEIGLPVVVKPRDADYGNGVSVHLLTKAQVVAGWELARQYRTDVLVERHLAGVPHRLLIVNDVLVAAVRRDPAHIVGDGRQTMNELIAAANRDPRRGDGPEFPWFPILIDEKLLQVLTRQGFHLASVPPAGLLVTLQHDPKTCYAEMILDVTDGVHPDVAAVARDAVRVTGLDVAGVDVMAVDITKPLAEQDGGILEVNAGPAIYLHRSPMCNPPRPVPEAVVASLIPPHETGRIPIVAVLGDGSETETAARIGELLQTTGSNVGVSSATGIRVGRRTMTTARANDSAGCQALLLHPRVETAVCELTAEGILNSGLPFDECPIAVLPCQVTRFRDSADAGVVEKCVRVLVDAVSSEGMIVVNIEEPWLAAMFKPGDERILAVTSSKDHPFLRKHLSLGGACAYVEDGGALIVHRDEIVRQNPHPKVTTSVDFVGLSQLLAIAVAWVVRRAPADLAAANETPRGHEVATNSLVRNASRFANQQATFSLDRKCGLQTTSIPHRTE
jgi:cyanophycin synthetase